MKRLLLLILLLSILSCKVKPEISKTRESSINNVGAIKKEIKEDIVNQENNDSKTSFVEQFADIKVLRYEIPQWNKLTIKQKKLVYYLTQAGLSGRDIMYDQNYRYNLKIRRALENVYINYNGDKSSDNWKNCETYLKKIWFANGIHHHYSNDKFKPSFTKEYLNKLLRETNTTLVGGAYEVIFNDKD